MAPFAEALGLLATIPGVQRRTAEVLLAEIGTEVTPFPTADHLASWAGLRPGNNQSAGRRRTGKTRKGGPRLRAALLQAAWSAARTKDTYLAARSRRLSARRGRKRAAAAVAHTLVVVVYHVLSRRQADRDLGADSLDRLDPDRLANRPVRRLERLGLKVTVEPHTAA